MQHPLPTPEELHTYYEASYSSGMYRTFVEAETMKTTTAASRFDAIARHVPAGRWLDVGCSSGQFVSHARSRGVACEGIDLSETAVSIGTQSGLPLIRSTIEDWHPAHLYDAITCFDVLEHVLFPTTFLDRVNALLRPGGSLVVTVPNLASLSRRIMGKRWFFYIPEEHLHYFWPSTLTRLIADCGFAIRRCDRAFKPMTFTYALTQFREYNPSIYATLSAVAGLVPRSLADAVVPLPLGEMCVIAQKE